MVSADIRWTGAVGFIQAFCEAGEGLHEIDS